MSALLNLAPPMAIGDTVVGATINKSGNFRYGASNVGSDAALAQIVKLVQEAQNPRAPAIPAERISGNSSVADGRREWKVSSNS